MPGWRRRISCAAWMPSSVWVGGMRMSTMATSGSWRSTAASSSSAVDASATTSIPSPRTNDAMPSRNSRLSSAITTRTGAPP
jgi:hypothetical protein